MKMQIVPVFKDIFPNEEQPSLEKLIDDIPTDLIVKFGSYINAELYFSKNRLPTEIKIFIHLIERITDNKLRNEPYKNFEAFKQKLIGHEVAIFTLPHTLKIIEAAYLSKYIPYSKSTPEQDLKLLKAILVLNSAANDRTIQVMKDVDLRNPDSVYKVFWESLLPNSTLLIRKDLIISVYMSLIFLKFLESKHSKYLAEFLAFRKVDKHHQITLQIFDLYSNGYNKEKDSFFAIFNKDVAEKNPLVQTLTLDIKNSSREKYLEKKFDKHFKGLRNFPVQKSSDEQYYINNWGFIVEKFYDGLVFDFYNHTSINGEKGMNSLDNYKSRLGEEFSNPFFMDLMDEIFSKTKCIHYREKIRSEKCDYDYYIRIKNCVFIFEFKDILFPINESFQDIKKTLDTKLISNEKDSRKGINQLIRHANNFNQTPDIFDDLGKEGLSLEDVSIYPIIVYTDHAFGMPAVNHYLNERFQAELKKLTLKTAVKPLAMISLHFFMEEFSNLQQGKYELVSLVDQYYEDLDDNWKKLSQEMNSDTLEGAYSSFDSLTRQRIPSESKDMLNSVFFERIMTELKPHLPPK